LLIFLRNIAITLGSITLFFSQKLEKTETKHTRKILI
jgi:hypothetical protein